MKTDKIITSFDDYLNEQYGKIGTESRNEFQEEFETFKIGILIQEARKKQHLTQEQLAERVGTTKKYISRGKGEIIHNSGHFLSVDQAKIVNKKIIDFMKSTKAED